MVPIGSGSDGGWAIKHAAAEFGMALCIKNTFLEFEDESRPGLRKVQTTRSRSQPIGRANSALGATTVEEAASPLASHVDVGSREDVANPASDHVLTHGMVQGNATSTILTSPCQADSNEACYPKPLKHRSQPEALIAAPKPPKCISLIAAPKPVTPPEHEQRPVCLFNDADDMLEFAEPSLIAIRHPNGTGHNRRRPCKGQRQRYRQQASRLETLVARAPETFDPDALELPPSIERNPHVKQKLIARLVRLKEDTLSMKASAGDQCQTY